MFGSFTVFLYLFSDILVYFIKTMSGIKTGIQFENKYNFKKPSRQVVSSNHRCRDTPPTYTFNVCCKK